MARANTVNITSPCKLPRSLSPDARRMVETAMEAHWRAVEALTAFLDAAEGDADDEPSLGSQNGSCGGGDQLDWAGGSTDDREDEHDGCEFSYNETHGAGGAHSSNREDDEEPSLSLTLDINQERALKLSSGTAWVPGSDIWYHRDEDLEAEHCGREPDADLEPNGDDDQLARG